MEAPPPLDDGPEKKKTKGLEKPLPPILEDMDSLSLNDYEFTTEFRPIKDSKGVEETREVALSVAKANTTINLDKDLNVHQLRKLVRKLGVTKGNLNKTECQYYMWKTKQELGTINHNLAHDSSVPQAVGQGRASRCSTPTSMVTAPTNDSHSEIATAIASMKDSMVEDSKKREECLDRASLLHEFQTIQQMIKDEDDVEIKATMKKRFKELSDSLFK